MNNEFADKKTEFDLKFGLLKQFFKSELKIKFADNDVHLYIENTINIIS